MGKAAGRDENRQRFISNRTIRVCFGGIILNLVLSTLASIFSLPLYLDCVGSILVAVLEGGFPAIIVAFLTNAISSIQRSLYLYYGIAGVLIAWAAAVFARKGRLKKWTGWAVAVICFAVIGCGISAILGWYLFGRQINGVAAPLAFWIESHGLSAFASQMSAEFLVELLDKSLTAGIVCGILRRWKGKENRELMNYTHSVNRRLTRIVVTSVAAVGVCSLLIGVFYYQQLLRRSSRYNSQYFSSRAAAMVDGDRVTDQLAHGEQAEGYMQTKEKLQNLYEQGTDIRYLYVYVVKESGCYALYDVDVPGENGRSAGTYIERDPDIYNRLEEFLAGGEIQPGYGNSPYGTLISAYTPVYNSQGETVAYACADINLDAYVQNLLIYVIQFLALVFAIILGTVMIMMWYVNRHVVQPIRSIVKQTKALDQINPEDWLDSEEWASRIPVQTDDELEDLYEAVTRVEKNASINVKRRIETEQKLIQTEELESINRELEAMIQKADDANQAKTDFLSRMSHDMRTPMNAIIGLSALTLDDAEKPEVVRENMGKIRSSSDFLLGLVNDILDLAKIEDGSVVLKPEPYSYQEFLTNMRTMFQAQCDAKDIQLDFKLPRQNPMVQADKLRLNQIFFNIFSNAVKYTPVGGRISYRIENLSIQGDRLTAEAVIADTGIGMSEEYQKHLFEPFAQENSDVTPELQGSGLGLSITKQLVDLMGGKITIESKKNVGTTVRVLLNFQCIAPDCKEIKAVEEDSGRTSSLDGERVLLAEDHPLNAQIARKLLEKKGIQVLHGENGRVAVELFRSSPLHSIDGILMDIRMPELSGLDATREIRKLPREDAKTVPIIAMSANAYSEDIQKSLDAGMNAHLAKPVDPKLLYEVLAQYL